MFIFKSIMKQLLLIRHAKSDRSDPALEDFDRPLNERGRKDAPLMAKRILEQGVVPGLLVSSAARRARQTARLMAAEWDYEKKRIVLEERLYEAGLAEYYAYIPALDDSLETVALFGHNPTIGLLADALSPAEVDHFPTCGCALFQIHSGSWKNFRQAEKTLRWLGYPAR
ncbi:SixA phosphatase family protein [Compostibacter hankyongensis]|uniref:Phosphohistidine phosphatase SixA n=1 Tax=Compostibacter hankyongensis TaxID=1007089 RepID=A0ABP8G5K1_9BACT